MITQNPIIGRARKKIAGVYSRTLWGKNIIQSCPPSTKGKQTATQVAASKAFSKVSLLSNQVSQSDLNALFYEQPNGRSRRAEWMRQLSQGLEKINNEWTYNPEQIQQLGGNAVVTNQPISLIPAQNSLQISIDQISAVNKADTSKIPCIILICTETNQCISLVPFTTVSNGFLVLHNLSPTFLQKECYLYVLWQENVGTQTNPIWAYGSYVKS